MSSFFAKGFKASNCKTMLKLTIPRIKLLRNRKEIQLKQMRRDIAKLLETGQEATARIRVEHIIREEKMIAAQEIVELFSELIVVRLPIIEAQRECPLDLKEAISSLCFAAPRCADLPELQQVQMLFAAKYGKEFVAAATDLRPECGVNRQLVELLSVRAPDPEVKLKLLKDIAEEHGLDWDPAASETELLKPHEDLLNGPSQFVSGSQLPLPEKKHNESAYVASKQSPTEEPDNDDGFKTVDFPEVPKTSVRPTLGTVPAPEMLPFPEVEFESTNDGDSNEETLPNEPEVVAPHKGSEKISSVSKQSEPEVVPHYELKNLPSENKSDLVNSSPVPDEASKQFVPFMSAPLSPTEFSVRESEPLRTQPLPRTKRKVDVDLHDVLAAAQAAADSAERAAASARSAATLAQVRISELVKKRSDEIPDGSSENPFHLVTYEAKNIDKPQIFSSDSLDENIVKKRSDEIPDGSSENPFHLDTCEAKNIDKPQISRSDSLDENIVFRPHLSPLPSFDDHKVETDPSFPSYYYHNVEFDSSEPRNDFPGLNVNPRQPQRLPSMDDEYLSYPNLFTRQNSNIEPGTHASDDTSHPAK